MIPAYRHTQIGWLLLIALGGATIGALTSTLARPTPVGWIVVGVLAGCLAMFSTLTVTGDPAGLEVRFGPGLIRKRFRWSDIRSASRVRNSWLAGWGIRWMAPGWMFNVSGLDAVELQLQNGKMFRIGTDDPQGLQTFIADRTEQR